MTHIMALKTYCAPETEVCLLNTRDPQLVEWDPDDTTSGMLTNEGTMDLTESLYGNEESLPPSPSLWDE